MYIYIYMYIMYVKNERRKWLERVSRNSYREWSIIVAKRAIFQDSRRVFFSKICGIETAVDGDR